MPRTATSSSRGPVFGSARLHPYAQQSPILPHITIEQPTPFRATHHRPTAPHSTAPHRGSQQVSGISSLSIDGTYDDDDEDMSHVSTQSTEHISHARMDAFKKHDIEYPDSPFPLCPPSPPCPILPNINQSYIGIEHLPCTVRRSSLDRLLPVPANSMGYDAISEEQLARLERGPIKYLDPAEIGLARTQAQVADLLYPRVCLDLETNEIVDRFHTDSPRSSGRVYDRLYRRELARISPYTGEASEGSVSRQVFDVYTGQIRSRLMYDDFRDNVARTKGQLEIIDDELNVDYVAVQESWLWGEYDIAPRRDNDVNWY